MIFGALGYFLLVKFDDVIYRIGMSCAYNFVCLFSYCFCMWLEELVKGRFMEDANRVFLKGANGGLRATDELYDLMIEEDCKVGDHSNALDIAYAMEEAGRMATTFHFNCLLSVQVSRVNFGM